MCETNNIDGHGVRRDLTADEISGFKEYIKRKVSNQKRVIASLNQIQKDDKDTIYDDFPFLEDNFQVIFRDLQAHLYAIKIVK